MLCPVAVIWSAIAEGDHFLLGTCSVQSCYHGAVVTIPTTSFVNDFGSLRAIKAVLIWKERFNTEGVLKNYL